MPPGDPVEARCDIPVTGDLSHYRPAQTGGILACMPILRHSSPVVPHRSPRTRRATTPHARTGRRHHQHGAGMAGFLLAAIPVLSLGLGGVEAAHWASLRQTLSLALMDAARTGATRQARPQAIAQAFEHGLHMFYPDPRAAARALRERQAALGTPWQIRIVQPSPAAFLDHADPDLPGPRDHPGQSLIRNDYQAQQQARRLAQGWPGGRGPQSALTIHEANTLVLELWWPHRPLLPGVATIVRTLAPWSTDPQQRRLMTAGYLPFRRRVSVAMHSHPADWSGLADGRVTYATAASTDAGIPPVTTAETPPLVNETRADPPEETVQTWETETVPETDPMTCEPAP